MGKVADVGGDDDKALAIFPGPRRLDRAIDGQHAGLDRHGRDRIDDLVDPPRHQIQVLDLLDARARRRCRVVDAGDHRIDGQLVARQQLADLHDLLAALVGPFARQIDTALDLRGGGSRFLGRGRLDLGTFADLFDRRHDLGARLADFVHRRGQLFGCRRDFLRALGDVGRVFQIVGQVRHRLCRLLAFRQRHRLFGDGLGRFLGGGRLLFGGGGDFLHALQRLLGGDVGLGGTDGDFLNAGHDRGDIGADLGQLLGDRDRLGDLLVDCGGRLVDAGSNLAHIGLDLADQLLNLAGAALRRFGQRAHLVGDDGKALAMLAGMGGLDRGIEGEQIGLVGNAADGLHDIVDIGRLLFQFGDHLHRCGLAVRGGGDIADQSGDFFAGACDDKLRRLALFPAGVGILHLAGDRAGNLLECSQRHLGGARRLFGPDGDLVRRALQLFGGGGGFVDARGQLGAGGGDALCHLLLLGERACPLAAQFGLARRTGGCGARRDTVRPAVILNQSHAVLSLRQP